MLGILEIAPNPSKISQNILNHVVKLYNKQLPLLKTITYLNINFKIQVIAGKDLKWWLWVLEKSR